MRTETTAHPSISLDGFAAGPDQTREHPTGRRGHEVHTWHMGDERATDADTRAADRLFNGTEDFGFEPVEVLHLPLVIHVRYRQTVQRS